VIQPGKKEEHHLPNTPQEQKWCGRVYATTH